VGQKDRIAEHAKHALLSFADKKRAEASLWFFKTGPGEYGEGDKFIGASVPNIRKVAKEYRDISSHEIIKLLHEDTHEFRQLALFIMTYQFERGDAKTKQFWYQNYLENIKYVNGWDLVDATAHVIVGGWLEDKHRNKLYELAKKKDLWSRRVAVIATFRFIRLEDFEDALAISEILLHDEEDLIQKAVGWMLREIGNRDRQVLLDYLRTRYQEMPRTMLRYAIEKLPEALRQDYLKGTI
jgi:3-methyladenine DNA glycosylase AlkD